MNQVLVAADEAVLFVTDRADDRADDRAVHERMLDEALMRMAVTASRRRVVALADQPELGARWQVRVTPCLVLDIGSRQVYLPGDPARLDPARLEQALSTR